MQVYNSVDLYFLEIMRKSKAESLTVAEEKKLKKLIDELPSDDENEYPDEAEFLRNLSNRYFGFKEIIENCENLLKNDPQKTRYIYAMTNLYSMHLETITHIRMLTDLSWRAESIKSEVIDQIFLQTAKQGEILIQHIKSCIRNNISDKEIISKIMESLSPVFSSFGAEQLNIRNNSIEKVEHLLLDKSPRCVTGKKRNSSKG